METTKFHGDTLYDVLIKVCKVPSCLLAAPMRVPISGIHMTKSVSNVLAGRVEQGIMMPSEVTGFKHQGSFHEQHASLW